MDVIAMPEVILLVSDSVFPVTRLPNPAPPLATALLGYIPVATALGQVIPREQRLDLSPARGKIIIAVRQRPDAVKMVRKEDEGELVKRTSATDGGERTQKDSPRHVAGQDALPAIRDYGEEVSGSLLSPADIRGHGRKLCAMCTSGKG